METSLEAGFAQFSLAAQKSELRGACRSGKCFNLQDTTNKKQLFSLLTEKVKDFQFPENREVNITSGENVFSSGGPSDMQRCDHEEVDRDKNCRTIFIAMLRLYGTRGDTTACAIEEPTRARNAANKPMTH